jgi:hypothetical protein
MTKLTNEQRAEIERWAEALESGKYEQSTAVLHDDSGFCCLGVYAEICGAAWRETVDMYRAPFVDGKQVGGDGGDELLEINWLGDRTGIEKISGLTHANDSGVTFKVIAAGLRQFAETGKLPDWDG